MKLIYMWADGLKLFENNELEIDFTLQKLVRRTAIPCEVNEVLPDLFLPNTISFVGVNSSGKTITLKMIDIFNSLIFNGEQFKYEPIYKDNIELEVIYLIGEDLFSFNLNLKFKDGISYIDSYEIYQKKYLKTYYVNDYLFEYEDEELICSSKDGKSFDVSKLFEINHYYPMYCNECIDFKVLKKYQAYLQCVVKILDSNIEKLTIKENSFKIDLKYGDVFEGTFSDLDKCFSTGMSYGLYVFSRAMHCIDNGSIFIVDDLSSFVSKLVVEELIRLFQDELVNSKYATLMFATNYIELIDNVSRTDCVFFVKKHRGSVIYNLSKVVARNEKLKSKYIYNDSQISVRMKRDIKKSLVKVLEEDYYES